MGIKIAVLVQKLWQFSRTGEFCLLVELHREGSSRLQPAKQACCWVLFFTNTSLNIFDLCKPQFNKKEEEKKA